MKATVDPDKGLAATARAVHLPSSTIDSCRPGADIRLAEYALRLTCGICRVTKDCHMSATAASLLNVMKVRLSMYDSGLIQPSPDVIDATRLLVHKLNLLDPVEEIEVQYSESPLHVQYIRTKTKILLAEFTVASDEHTFRKI